MAKALVSEGGRDGGRWMVKVGRGRIKQLMKPINNKQGIDVPSDVYTA